MAVVVVLVVVLASGAWLSMMCVQLCSCAGNCNLQFFAKQAQSTYVTVPARLLYTVHSRQVSGILLPEAPNTRNAAS